MSKTLDYLKKIQEARKNKSQSGSPPATPTNKYTHAINATEDAQGKAISKKTFVAKKIPVIIFNLFISVSLGINVIMFFSLKNISLEKKSDSKRISEVEQSLNKAIKKFETQGTDIKKTNDTLSNLNSKLKDTNQKLTRLEKDIDKTKESTQFDIENLNKAKNTILNKISSLTAKIDEVKSAKQQ